MIIFYLKYQMTDFFTPIEVSQANQGLTDKYEIDKYDTDPFMPTLVRIESLGDHRKKIMQWLKNMSTSARVSRLTFTNKQFACLIITMCERSWSRKDCLREFGLTYSPQVGFRIAEQRFISKPNPDLLLAEKKLTESILIVNRYSRYDSITVDETLASDVNQLFQLFDIIENGISHELTAYNCQNYTRNHDSHIMFYNPVEHDCSITKTLGLWFVEVIKKSLCVQYFRDCVDATPNTIHTPKRDLHEELLQQENMQKEKAREFKKYWTNISQSNRQGLIQKILERDIRAILSEYRHTIKISGDSFPSLKYCHPDEISNFIASFITIPAQSLFNQLTYTQLKDCSFDIGLYKYQAFLEIESGIESRKMLDLAAAKKKVDRFAQHKKNRRKNNELESCRDQACLKQEKLTSATILTKPLESSRSYFGDQKQIERPNKKETKKGMLWESRVSEVPNQQEVKESRGNVEQEQIEQSSEAEKQFEKVVEEFNTKIKKWNKYREIAINRLIRVLASYNLSCQLFGSSSNGLAIPNSDVDICISPTIIDYFYSTFCTYREKVIMGLKFLWACFSSVGWAGNFKLITTASVPLLAFEVDLSIPFGDPKNLAYNSLKLMKSPKICIDLTIEPYANMEKELVPHLGYQSTALVKEWLAEYKHLNSLICIVKHVLYKKDLNKSFTGGLSSYALSSLAYSFIKADPTSEQKTLMKILAQFCDFINHFDHQNRIISVKSSQPFQNKKVDRLTVENYLNGKNLTENCHRFEEIKAQLAKVRQTLMSYGQGVGLKEYCRRLRSLFVQ